MPFVTFVIELLPWKWLENVQWSHNGIVVTLAAIQYIQSALTICFVAKDIFVVIIFIVIFHRHLFPCWEIYCLVVLRKFFFMLLLSQELHMIYPQKKSMQFIFIDIIFNREIKPICFGTIILYIGDNSEQWNLFLQKLKGNIVVLDWTKTVCVFGETDLNSYRN